MCLKQEEVCIQSKTLYLIVCNCYIKYFDQTRTRSTTVGIMCIRKKAFLIYCLISVEQHQVATYMLVALQKCCFSEVILNGQCHSAGEIVLPVESGSRLLEVQL